MNKLTIVLSGKKQSGKTSSCNYIRAKYLNRKNGFDTKGKQYYYVDNSGELNMYLNGNCYLQKETLIIPPNGSVKLYSFADPLKSFLIDVFGIPWECCYGSDEQKNQMISHLLWENVPDCWRPYEKSDTDGSMISKTGPMTSRQMMQLFGTDICRKLYGDCWARGTYSAVKNDGHELALISDGRFPNEIKMGNSVSAKTVRLLRNVHQDNHASEQALDSFGHENYSVVIDNSNLTFEQQMSKVDDIIEKWFKESGI